MKNNIKVDFVILWVDGNDKKWLNEKSKYTPNFDNKDNDGKNRYRDWDNLQYWFRGVEENANWVNNIYFITWGHIPKWLNTNNPKLKIINHKDYIPEKFLPTYNSNTIELNLFRLEELSENFVLFNDDQFIMNKTKKEDFFKFDLPVEYYSECLNVSDTANDTYSHNNLNNMSIVNKYFSKRDVYKKNIFKYFNIKYGIKGNLTTLLLLPFKKFSMIENQHLPVALKKSVLEKLWNLETETMTKSSLNRFRDLTDVSQFLIRYYQLCSGSFYPRHYNFGKSYALSENIENIINDINKNKYKTICLNDTINVTNFESSKNQINEMFNSKYPNKSTFEK